MRIYIGTKIIQAEPMDLATFNAKVRGKDVVEQDKTVLGYKVVYPPFKFGNDDYVSWSPKDVFENAYREITESEKASIVLTNQ